MDVGAAPTAASDALNREFFDRLIDGFVDDHNAHLKMPFQGPLLCNCARPEVGQRVDVKMSFTVDPTGASRAPITQGYMAGEITGVGPFPRNFRPMESCDDRGPGKGSMSLSGLLNALNNIPDSENGKVTLNGQQLQLTKWGQYCSRCVGTHGKNYETTCPPEMKEMHKEMVRSVHGQEITIQARSHFDNHNGLRENIPLHELDVWEMQLYCDDAKENVWCLKAGSLRNLGPHVRHEGWPWHAP